MSIEELKKHPMFPMLVAAVGEKQAVTLLRHRLEEEEKQNQATTEFSETEKKIIIPVSMNKLQASKELERQWNDEETVIEVGREFNEWNWKDVLVAVKKAAERHFGWIQGKTEYTFFGPKRPKEISVITNIVNGVKITEECFYGKFTVGTWEDCTIDVKAEYISATVKKRYADEVRQFLDLVQEILDKESIYRGKAVTVTEQIDPWGNISLNFEIFELKPTTRIVLNEEVETVLNNFVIDDLGRSGKRACLFSGGYGTIK